MGAPLKVVIDTNVLISALLWQGNTKELFQLSRGGKIIICASKEIVEEFQKVLEYPKFQRQLQLINKTAYEVANEFIEIVKLYSGEKFPVSVVREDPSDNKFLACALAAEASCTLNYETR